MDEKRDRDLAARDRPGFTARESALLEDEAPHAVVERQREHRLGLDHDEAQPLEAALLEDEAPHAVVERQREHRLGLDHDEAQPLEAARKRRGKPLQPDGLFAFDDVEPDDREVSDYRARRQRQRQARQLHACIIPEGETGEIIDEDAQLSQKPLFASSVVKSDPYFQELGVLRDALVVEGREVNAPAIQCVEEQMRRRMQQLRSDERKAAKAEARREQWLLEQHSYLDGVALAGLPLSKLGLSEDEEFTRLAEEHTVLAASPEKNAEALAAKEQCLKARAAQLAAAVVRQEAALREQMPYLMHLPFDVALRELHLESNPEFVALLAKHAALCEDPDRAGGAEAKRLERAMRDLAKRIAEDVVEARRRALVETENLHEKYPCLPEEPAPGVAIVEVGLVRIPCFTRCRTSWTVCTLTRPKMRNRLRRRRGRCEHGRWSLVPRSCRQPKRSNASTHFFRDAWMTCL
ncbi:hypothetical protein C4B63_83g91 [Trypanosoma cruzi]|uniref:DUF7623 domain-containing protein n=1 Tax=Trypanosoma cruzi TaxID=5693 RepID=A0A2V2UU43_TRYCR|nr:hypothetical protein C4B63_83g91 [Trypanosoma cruzi]